MKGQGLITIVGIIIAGLTFWFTFVPRSFRRLLMLSFLDLFTDVNYDMPIDYDRTMEELSDKANEDKHPHVLSDAELEEPANIKPGFKIDSKEKEGKVYFDKDNESTFRDGEQNPKYKLKEK